jgi:hypothetical protein
MGPAARAKERFGAGEQAVMVLMPADAPARAHRVDEFVLIQPQAGHDVEGRRQERGTLGIGEHCGCSSGSS